ncbi:MAG: twin-arginine translocase subunit TatC [candidate division Zixibacteria bacterium]|nr:twin-arginine translocase subunit TatC [candidate division Zixibacteria bacterium]
MTPRDQPDPGSDNPAGNAMPFLDHLEELRRRILKSILAVVILSGVAFYFAEDLMRFLIRPLGEVKLHVTEVSGSFYAYIKVALIFGIGGSLPVIFYQLWMFISPGLYRRERAMVLPLILLSVLLFLIGAGFCYLVVLPFALEFLIGFGGDILSPIITVSSYLGFAGMLLLSFGFGFELPILAYFMGKMGLISSRALGRFRRYAIVVILIVAAILTPTPDVFTQLLLAVPLYVLYEISIVVVRVSGRRH